MSAEQQDLINLLKSDERREARIAHARTLMRRHLAGRPETYADRHHFGCLLPREACPGCGYVFALGGSDSSGDHVVLNGAAECEGRRAYREHAARAARDLLAYEAMERAGRSAPARVLADAWTRYERAVAAAAPCWSAEERQTWLDHPEQLTAKGTA